MTSLTKMPNRNPVRSFFITFPQWEEDKQGIHDLVSGSFKCSYICTCQEAHADGGIHYHILVKLEEAQTKASLLKRLKELFPNDYKRIDVQPLKNWKQSLSYVSKEDGDLLEMGDKPISSFISAAVAKRTRKIALIDEDNDRWSRRQGLEGWLDLQECSDMFRNMSPYEKWIHYPYSKYRRYYEYLGVTPVPDSEAILLKWHEL